MGSRMAPHLAAKGFLLTGFDPDTSRMSEFASKWGLGSASPAEAVQGCWGALLSLPNSDVSREVCLGEDGLAASGVSPLYVFDTTTGRPDDAVEIAARLAEQGVTYCDATLSGNGELAERADLVVMVGGPEAGYRQGVDLFRAIARSSYHVGPNGAGARMKLIVNHVLSIHRMALAEALVVAETSGLDLSTTLAVLGDGMAYSKAMDGWGERMASRDHEPPFSRLSQSLKDVRLIVEHGASQGSSMDLARVVELALSEGIDNGFGEMDNSSIIEVVRSRAGMAGR
jgi:3-hydroxyisobutyrate dehydrogenase-like beta-hydroxyacid dehydrogenase